MANILVTGGAGYIGSHTCKQQAAVERAHTRLGWRAQMSDLDTIAATAWAWHRAQSGQS